MTKALSFLLKLAVVVGCLAYAFWGIDFGELWGAMSGYSLGAALALILLTTAMLIIPGVRLRYLAGPGFSVLDGAKASALGLGLNNIFPAKLGEVAKAFYVSRKCGFSSAKGLGLIFWERFFDINFIFCLAVFSLGVSTKRLPIWPGIMVILAGWVCVGLLAAKPHWAEAVLRLLPVERLRLFFVDFVRQLHERTGLGFFGALGALTITVWGFYFMTFYLGMSWLAGIDLNWSQLLVAFVISSLGMAVPSSPGGVGVYEAAIIFALGLYGVGKEEALAAGLVLHMIQLIPTTVIGVLVMSLSGIKLRQLRTEEV